MAEKNLQRKLIQIRYSTDLVQGNVVSVQAIQATAGGIQTRVELLKTRNDGLCEVSYPQDFSGPAALVIRGSAGGEDPAQFEVE